MKDYAPSIDQWAPLPDQWAPLPITDAMVEGFLTNPYDEIRLIAELDRVTVGIGALVAAAGGPYRPYYP